jgi:hypothetical protein
MAFWPNENFAESFGLIQSLLPASEGKYRICARMMVSDLPASHSRPPDATAGGEG